MLAGDFAAAEQWLRMGYERTGGDGRAGVSLDDSRAPRARDPRAGADDEAERFTEDRRAARRAGRPADPDRVARRPREAPRRTRPLRRRRAPRTRGRGAGGVDRLPHTPGRRPVDLAGGARSRRPRPPRRRRHSRRPSGSTSRKAARSPRARRGRIWTRSPPCESIGPGFGPHDTPPSEETRCRRRTTSPRSTPESST